MISRTNDLDDLLAGCVATTPTVGAAVGLVSGGTRAVGLWGTADGTVPVTRITRFGIASVTKPMVATACARLIAAGSIDLTGSIAEHVPELHVSPWARAATIARLLGNTSGVPMTLETEFAAGGDDDALARLCAVLAPLDPLSEPGERWSYTNTGWSVLGRVIEVASGQVWEEAMRTLVCEPAGMRSVSFLHEPSERAAGFETTAAGFTPTTDWTARGCGPAGSSLFCSIDDLLAFAAPHLDDPALAWLRETTATVSSPWFLDHWCAGWARFDWPGGPVWGWDGISSAGRAILRFVPGRGAVAMVSNTSNGRQLYRQVFPSLLAQLGVEMPQPPTSGPRPPDLDRYCGTYSWADRSLTVDIDDGDLLVTDSADPHPRRLTALDRASFLGDPLDPDGDAYGFDAFDTEGRPQMAYRLIWGFPRVS